MPSTSNERQEAALWLSLAERWVVHYVLLNRSELEQSISTADPPAIEVFRAFDKLDAGTTTFTWK